MPIRPLPGEPEPAPLGFSLDRIVRHLGGPSAGAVTALFDRWHEIVGRPLSDHTWPISLSDQLLTVGVDDAAWASQLRFLERELCGQVNDALGPGAADAVTFRVRPRGPVDGAPDDGADDVADDAVDDGSGSGSRPGRDDLGDR